VAAIDQLRPADVQVWGCERRRGGEQHRAQDKTDQSAQDAI
jgi:hypothetical protein